MPSRSGRRWGTALVAVLVTGAATAAGAAPAPAVTRSSPARADRALDRALDRLVARPDGPPGVAVVVQRGAEPVLHAAGTAVVGADAPIRLDDHLRIASASKALNGAVASSLVASGDLALDDTVGRFLPDLPATWAPVTLRQLLQHTSGIPDFSQTEGFQRAVVASLDVAPPPATLLSYAADDPLRFEPGTDYEYSNSDNVIVALMAEAVTGRPYADVLGDRVLIPLALTDTSLPAGSSIPEPVVRGYDVDPPNPPEDVTSLFAAGWAWSSGGVVSTPADANRFVRGYLRGVLTDAATRDAQLSFVKGSSEPRGPGRNRAGLGVFRYRTECGTVYGHTGNTPGYTQLIAADRDGRRSVSVSINAQITPTTSPDAFRALRNVYELAVCSALA